WVDSIAGFYSDHRDPYLFMVFGRVKSEELMPKVESAIYEAIERLKSDPVDAERLERVKSNLRYSFALGLDSPGNVALTISNFLVLTGDPESVNRVYEQYAKVTPEDVQRLAGEVFQERGKTLVTLTHAAAEAATTEAADVASGS
ncbi:MAG: hypothetical protein R3190_11740, partial [Thermoanaerobaculia bacterium]|nr:hypothetical protein [Thermoanaerobaculia bacterium]